MSANHSLPTVTSSYSNFVSELDARFDDLALMLASDVVTATNLPDKAIRWNNTSKKLERYSTAGSTWSTADFAYLDIPVTQWKNATTIALANHLSGSVAVNGNASAGTTSTITATLATVAGLPVTAVGSTTSIPVITVDTYGRVSVLSSTSIGSIATQSSSNISITGGNISGTDITLRTARDASTPADGNIWWETTDDTLRVYNGTSDIVFPSNTSTHTFTNKSFSDSTTWFIDEADATKKFQFQLSGITTGNTRVYTAPNSNGTFSLLELTQTWTAAQTLQLTDAGTNTVLYPLIIDRQSSGTPANGIGVGMQFKTETTPGVTEIGAVIEAVVTDITAASEDFDLVIKTMAAGAAASEGFRVKSTGGVSIPSGSYQIAGTSVLTSTSLGSAVVASSLTSVGTLATGTWQATVIGSLYGGTGVNNGGRTLTINTNSGTIAFPGASTTMTFPSVSATLAGIAVANTWTASQTFRPAATQDAVVIAGRAGGTNSYAITISPTTLTGNGSLTLADGNTILVAGTVLVSGGALGTPSSGTMTNVSGTANNLTAGVALGLKSATTTVSVSAATAPSNGQALIATSSTTATWQNINTTASSVAPTLVNVSGTSQTAAANNHYVLENAAATTVTMPAGTAGDVLWITVANGRTDNVINVTTNATAIDGDATNLTIDVANATLQLRHCGATSKWRIL